MLEFLLLCAFALTDEFTSPHADAINRDYKKLKKWMLSNKISHLMMKEWSAANDVEPWAVYRESYPLDKPIEIVYLFVGDNEHVDDFKERQSALDKIYPAGTQAYTIHHFHSKHIYVWAFMGEGNALRATAERFTSSVHTRVFLYAECLAIVKRFYDHGWSLKHLQLHDFLVPSPLITGPMLVAFSQMIKGNEQHSVDQVLGVMEKLESESREARAESDFRAENMQKEIMDLVAEFRTGKKELTFESLKNGLASLCEASAQQLAKVPVYKSKQKNEKSPLGRMREARDRMILQAAAGPQSIDAAAPISLLVLWAITLGLLAVFLLLLMGILILVFCKWPKPAAANELNASPI